MKPGPAVQARPRLEAVEREHVRAEGLEPAALVAGARTEPQLVERADRPRPEQPGREPGRDRGAGGHRRPAGVRAGLLSGRVLGAGDDAAARPGAEQVEPGDAMGAARAREDRQRRVEVADAVGVDDEQRALHAAQHQARPDDHAGQAHPAERRLERGVAGLDLEQLAAAGDEPECLHVAAERAGAAVVLAVDVAGDRPAERHVLGAGNDRHDEAVGGEQGEQLADRHPGLGGDVPRRRGRARWRSAG